MHKMVRLWLYPKIYLNLKLFFKIIISKKIKQMLENQFISLRDNIGIYFKNKFIKIVFITISLEIQKDLFNF